MMTHEPTMSDLFIQLGLDNSQEAIEQFIASHQLPQDVFLNQADYWAASQSAFIQEEWRRDAMWTHILDELNIRLHEAKL